VVPCRATPLCVSVRGESPRGPANSAPLPSSHAAPRPRAASSTKPSDAAGAKDGAPAPVPVQSQLRHIAEVTGRSPTPLPTELTRPVPPLAQWPAMVVRGLVAALKATARFTGLALKYTAEGLMTAVRDPAAFRAQMSSLWSTIKHEAHHFWVGSKLFASEVKVASALVRRVGRGESLSRRERLQLKRAVNDLLRMVPFIVIVIVPFAEFSLPVLLKVFPNMLPSQFEVRGDGTAATCTTAAAVIKRWGRGGGKRETGDVLALTVSVVPCVRSAEGRVPPRDVPQEPGRQAGATRHPAGGAAGSHGPLQCCGCVAGALLVAATGAIHYPHCAGRGDGAQSVDALLAEMESVRAGAPLPPATVVKVAQMFRDEVTLDNLPRGQVKWANRSVGGWEFATGMEHAPFPPPRPMQLAALAKFVGISPFAPETLLRFQLRSKMRDIREDDKDLFLEGTQELTAAELQAACEARGMQAIGLKLDAMRAQLDEWLQLSVAQKVPMTLLLLSRSFVIAQPRGAVGADGSGSGATAKALQESISAIDSNVVNEVVLAQRPASGERTAADMERQLESLEFQNELIEAEREAEVRVRVACAAQTPAPPPHSVPLPRDRAGVGGCVGGGDRRGGTERGGGGQRGRICQRRGQGHRRCGTAEGASPGGGGEGKGSGCGGERQAASRGAHASGRRCARGRRREALRPCHIRRHRGRSTVHHCGSHCTHQHRQGQRGRVGCSATGGSGRDRSSGGGHAGAYQGHAGGHGSQRGAGAGPHRCRSGACRADLRGSRDASRGAGCG